MDPHYAISPRKKKTLRSKILQKKVFSSSNKSWFSFRRQWQPVFFLHDHSGPILKLKFSPRQQWDIVSETFLIDIFFPFRRNFSKRRSRISVLTESFGNVLRQTNFPSHWNCLKCLRLSWNETEWFGFIRC